MIENILLWLFVIFSGIAVGAGLYEMRINVPKWFVQSRRGIVVNRDLMSKMNARRRFWFYATTIPLTLLTLLSLIFALKLQGLMHIWWLIGVAFIGLERIWTFAYFTPIGLKIIHEKHSNKVSQIARHWIFLNKFKAILSLVGWLAALKAFSLLGGLQ